MGYNYQRSASRIKATGGSEVIILPVDTMEVMAEPFVPEGGTLQRDYDGTGWFEQPTFRLILTLEWDYERTEARPTTYHTLQDLVAEYLNGNVLDFYVKYEQGNYDGNYLCPDMIPKIEDDDGGIAFQNRAREKERSIELESKSSTLSWSQVKFTYD